MNKIVIAFAVVSLTLISCSNSKKGSNKLEHNITQEMVDKVVISNLTMQEHVSGVEGGKNTMEFLLNADNHGTDIVLDSLYFLDYACKLFPKDKATGRYRASAKKSDNNVRTQEIKSVIITVVGSDKKISILETEMKVLDPLHMP